MKAYMRDQFEYLGIKTPQRRELLKKFIAENGLPNFAALETIVLELWALPEREYQYIALGFISRFRKELQLNSVELLEYLIVTKSWWDTVDGIAAEDVGTLFKRFPELHETYLAEWRKSDNFWLRRTAILFQLDYKKETDFHLLSEIIRENLGSKEFFINKAIGWALRQYARTDPDPVRKFVTETDLHPLSQREALKRIG